MFCVTHIFAYFVFDLRDCLRHSGEAFRNRFSLVWPRAFEALKVLAHIGCVRLECVVVSDDFRRDVLGVLDRVLQL